MYRIKQKIWVILFVFCVAILGGCRKQEEEMMVLEEVNLEEDFEETESSEIEEEIETIFIHVCGQVVNPGVYEVDESSRVYEVIHMAGGMTESAAKDYVNQAEPLTDGQKIYIPSNEEVEQREVQQNYSSSYVGEGEKKVNINIADKDELMSLTGIGEKRAEAILVYRQEKGTFENAEELMQVEGISQGIYDKIKDQITVL